MLPSLGDDFAGVTEPGYKGPPALQGKPRNDKTIRIGATTFEPVTSCLPRYVKEQC